MIKLTERKVAQKKDIADYIQYNAPQVTRIKSLGKKLQGQKIIHINATAQGGGVVELLESQVALERSLGMISKWFVIDAPPKFFDVTKKIHNLVQGQPGNLSASEQSIYLEVSAKLRGRFNSLVEEEQPDIVVVHDPQPLAVIQDSPHKSKMVSRIHVDLSKPNPKIIKFLAPYLNQYARIIISSKNFVPALPKPAQNRTAIIMPAIDPNSTKNKPLAPKRATQIITQLGLDPNQPIICQVSRFDPWKDPVGVVQAYLEARKKLPQLQLVLAGIMNAKDDPEAVKVFAKVKKLVNNDPQIILISNATQLGKISINEMVSAVFSASDVVLQKSIKEGFGLTITEAMWKGKAVVGGNAQGIRLQIKNNQNGLIVSNAKQAARAIVKLINNKKLRDRLGRAAIQAVKKQFLLPRYLLQNLQVYTEII
jgi:trehalose synthase